MGHGRRWTSSFLMVAKKQMLVLPTYGRTLLATQKLRNRSEVYWLPRSEWKMTPGAGWRFLIAMSRASMIRSVRMWSAIAQPMTLREWQSMTVARYAQPVQVPIR